MINVIKIPSNTTKRTVIVAINDDIPAFVLAPPTAPAMNMLAIVIKNGNLPLHGINAFVSIAISFSLAESIILHPVTPAALHPKPMHIVSACFPELPAFLKNLSKLNAILGKNPKSSNRVNNGKNIAIGGSITAIIHVKVLYTPSISMPLIHSGAEKKSNTYNIFSCSHSKNWDNNSDG